MKTILIAFMIMAFAFSMTACMDRGEDHSDERRSMDDRHQDRDNDHDDDDKDDRREQQNQRDDDDDDE